MKKAWLFGVVMCLSCSAIAQSAPESNAAFFSADSAAQPAEITGSLQYFFPSQQFSGFYDRMYGAEVQYSYWFSRPWGVSGVLGLMSADVRKDNKHLVDPSVGTFTDSASMVPIGVSVLYNLIDYGTWRIDGEAGLRYIFISSDIQVKSVATGEKSSVDLDNATVFVLRANVYRMLTEELDLFISAGMQNDIIAGDVSVAGKKVGDDNLKGYSLSLGLTYEF